jgi:hypothetical protein
MADLTNEEYDKLDEELTRSIPKTDPTRPGIAARRKAARMIELDDFSANYLLTVSTSTGLTPAQVVNKMIKEKVFA